VGTTPFIRSRLAAPARLEACRRFAAGVLELVLRFPALRRFAVVRRLVVVWRLAAGRFFRDERDVVARFLRFAICFLPRCCTSPYHRSAEFRVAHKPRLKSVSVTRISYGPATEE
jgi:hypothetical protein